MGDGHADGRTAGHRLHHAGHLGGRSQGLHLLFGVAHPLPLGCMYPQVGNQALGQVLVHGQAGTQITRPRVGNAHEIKGGLYPSVLPAGPVEGQKDDVRHLAELQHALAKLAGALPLPGSPNLRQVRCFGVHPLPLVGEGCVKIVRHRARVCLQAEVHIHQGRLVPQPPQGMGDHGARGQRDISLRAQSSGQHNNFHRRSFPQQKHAGRDSFLFQRRRSGTFYGL